MKRTLRGYTFAELLTVLGIIAILFAIALPAAASSYSSWQLRSLDAKAGELFLYMQTLLCRRTDLSMGYTLLDTDLYPEFFPPGMDGNAVIELTSTPSEDGHSANRAINVYYSESLSAGELRELCGTEPGESERSGQGIGFFSAEGNLLRQREYRFEPKIEVFNGEDLYLRVSCEAPPEAQVENFDILLTLTCGDIVTEPQTPYIFVENGVFEAYYLIDSGEFADVGAKKLTAAARIYCDGYGLTAETASERNFESFSPLFADSGNGEVSVNCVRHFNNLHYVSGVAVRQTGDIVSGSPRDFPFLPAGERILEPLVSFTGSYDGGDYTVSGVELSSGLFGELNGDVKNLHVVGAKLISTAEDASVGVLCNIASSDSGIVNCSVSDAVIEAAQGSNVGGLVGTLKGRVERSSADAEIIAPEALFAGGIAGALDGGTVAMSHSMGSISMPGAGTDAIAGGIAGSEGGRVENCYSEVCIKGIGKASYFGVCPGDCEGSYFLIENAWLDENSAGAVNSSELSVLGIPGFSAVSPYPESVTVKGRPERFGEAEITDPRGLIGIIRAEYSEGSFNCRALCLFDAYGNEPRFCPQAEWTSPEEGEARYYFVRSVYISDGWEFTLSDGASLGGEQSAGRFVAQEILGLRNGDVLTLRFKDEVRQATVEISEAEDQGVILGAFAVTHFMFDFNPDTWEFGEVYLRYCAIKNTVTHETYDAGKYPFSSFTPQWMDDFEYRLYIASSVPYDWSWNIYGDGISVIQSEYCEGIYYYEVYRGNISFDWLTKTVYIDYGGNKYTAQFDVIPGMDSLSSSINTAFN